MPQLLSWTTTVPFSVTVIREETDIHPPLPVFQVSICDYFTEHSRFQFTLLVILKLTSITEPNISVQIMSVQVMRVNNKSSIMKYDKNNEAYFTGFALTAFSF